MEITIDTTEGLPEAIKPLAQESDGKFKIDLAKLVPSSELDAAKSSLLATRTESIDRRKALDAWKALGTVEEVQAKLAKGADPQIIDQMRTQHAADIGARDQKLTSVMTRYAMSELKAELAKAGVVPEGLDLLSSFAAGRVRFSDEGEISVLAPDGKTPMIGSGTNGGATLAELAKSLASTVPQLVRDGGIGGGGKPPGSAGGGEKVMTRAAFDALDPAGKAAAVAAKTKITD